MSSRTLRSLSPRRISLRILHSNYISWSHNNDKQNLFDGWLDAQAKVCHLSNLCYWAAFTSCSPSLLPRIKQKKEFPTLYI